MTPKTFLTGALAALALGATVTASATPASAGWACGPYGGCYHNYGGWSPGAAAAVGAIGGLALGAALAAPRPAYGYGYGYPATVYESAPVYVEPGPTCYVTRRRVWVPGWGWEIRRRRVCEGY